MEKLCKTCNQLLPIDLFVIDNRKRDGHGSRCRNCHAAASKKYVTNNPEKRLESSRKYYTSHKAEHAVRVARWIKSHPEEVRAIRQKSRRRNPDTAREYYQATWKHQQEATRKKYPARYKARNKVNNAVAKGRLPNVRSLSCVSCSKPAHQYHHHLGYAIEHWLDVIPVCIPCHNLLDHPLTPIESL